MGRKKPDPKKIARAWQLVTKDGESLGHAAKIISDEFGCLPPQRSTIYAWNKKASQHGTYIELMNCEDGRRRVAERYRDLYGEARTAWNNGGMSTQEAAAFGAMLRIQRDERALFGLDAATRIQVESLEPEVDPAVVAAVRAVERTDNERRSNS